MQRQIYYTDLTYIDRQDGTQFGDMGYEFEDKLYSFNTDSLERNIESLREFAEECDREEGRITLLEVVSATAEFEEEDDEPYDGVVLDDTITVEYRIAVCRKEEWKWSDIHVDEFIN